MTNILDFASRHGFYLSLSAISISISSIQDPPEVNLRNPLHANDRACGQRIHSGFESPKHGYSGHTKRTDYSQKCLKRNKTHRRCFGSGMSSHQTVGSSGKKNSSVVAVTTYFRMVSLSLKAEKNLYYI